MFRWTEYYFSGRQMLWGDSRLQLLYKNGRFEFDRVHQYLPTAQEDVISSMSPKFNILLLCPSPTEISVLVSIHKA